MNSLLDKSEAHKVIGEIYKITNMLTNKMYIGQTRSHYLNRGKYRPFSYTGRFKSHISESKSLSKSLMSCRYLKTFIGTSVLSASITFKVCALLKEASPSYSAIIDSRN